MTTTARLALVPRDGLFCKDGRGWHTSASGRGHGLDWPWPSTILGALRSAWGRGEEARSGALFGPDDWRTRTAALRLGRTLTLRRVCGRPWRFEDTVWPVPMDALWLKGHERVYRLEPQRPDVPTLGRDDNDAREALWRPRLAEAGKPLASPRWWSSEDFTAWLAGQSVAVGDRDDVLAMARRLQVHVGILPEELTADEGVLFSHDVVETLDARAEWALGAEVTCPDGALSGVAALGSDARLARMESLLPELFEPPARLLEAFRSPSRGLRVVAVTPLCFVKGWLPDGLAESDGTCCGRLPGLDHDVVLRAVFGPSDDPAAHAGALVVGDARLLALAVRSVRGTFAWTTSPLLLTLAKRDLDEPRLSIPSVTGRAAQLARGSCCVHQGRLYLEDLDLPATESNEATAWAQRLAPLASPGDDIFTKRFAVVDDDTMAFLWDTATQVDARVRLDERTRTVAPGALWLEESLPPESLLIGVLAADRSRRRSVNMTPDDVLGFALGAEEIHQLGGKATTGRGRCRIVPIPRKEAGHGEG